MFDEWTENWIDFWMTLFDDPKKLSHPYLSNRNPKTGKKKHFKFHGAFKSKEDAIKKEKEVGGFIRSKNGRHYVITEVK